MYVNIKIDTFRHAGGVEPRVYDRLVEIELLYFDGCPGYAELRPRVEQLLAAEDRLDLVRVGSAAAAAAHRFLGSPTLRLNGHDVEPGADERRDFGMKCRIYAGDDGLRRTPSDEMIRLALDRAR